MSLLAPVRPSGTMAPEQQEMAVELAGRVDMTPPLADERQLTLIDQGRALTAVAVYDGHRWASLCPEVDIASVGGSAEDALLNLIRAVQEAANFATEKGLEVGQPVPQAELRTFMVSSRAPFYIRKFYA